jgi:hypothetical protein
LVVDDVSVLDTVKVVAFEYEPDNVVRTLLETFNNDREAKIDRS